MLTSKFSRFHLFLNTIKMTLNFFLRLWIVKAAITILLQHIKYVIKMLLDNLQEMEI